jgi:hypothetical protein
MMIPARLAAHLYELEDGDNTGSVFPSAVWHRIEEVKGDELRWRQICYLIVESPSGEPWRMSYQEGLTENCDPSYPWEHQTQVTLTRVFRKQITTHIWVTNLGEEAQG